MTLGGDLTVACWVKLHSIYTGWVRIFDFSNGPAADNLLAGFVTGELRFALYIGSSVQPQVSGSYTAVAGTWLHVCATITGSTVAFHVNGVQTAQ
eukprot:65395-Rhodomonas_salina.1